MTPEERAAIVFDIVKDGFTASADDLTVVASGASLDGGMVTLTLRAARDGESIPLDNPFCFVNPPLGIADGESSVVDPEAAVAEMLLQAVA